MKSWQLFILLAAVYTTPHIPVLFGMAAGFYFLINGIIASNKDE